MTKPLVALEMSQFSTPRNVSIIISSFHKSKFCKSSDFNMITTAPPILQTNSTKMLKLGAKEYQYISQRIRIRAKEYECSNGGGGIIDHARRYTWETGAVWIM